MSTPTHVDSQRKTATSAWGGAHPVLPVAGFLFAVLFGSLATVLFFSPTVGVREIQRRDRLPTSGQFVDFTYRYFLGRPADEAGLAEYQERYEREGPESVARAIVSSREFRERYADGRPVPGTAAQAGDAVDPSAIATQYVQRYGSGALQPNSSTDWLGRIGFVLLTGLTAASIVLLQRHSRSPLTGNALHAYLPRWFVLSVFSMLAVMWWLNSQLLFYSFAPGAMGYAEWLDRVTALSIARGVTAVWTPYPQGTQMVLVVLESIASTVSSWLNSDIWTSYTVFRGLFQAVFLLVPAVILVSVVYDIGMLVSPASATTAATIVGFSFAPVYYGVVSTLVTDPLAVTLALTAIWLWIRKRPGWAACALALGISLKFIPAVLMVPLVILAGSHRSRRQLVLATGAVLACIFVPFLIADADTFWSPLRWQSGRPPWQSWYAFVSWLVGAPHEYLDPVFEDIGFRHDFGWVFWGITPPLTTMTSPVPAVPLRWENVVNALGTIVSLLGVLAAKSTGTRSVIRWCMYALVVTFIWSPGWSPQYELYLIPLVALAFEVPVVAIGAAVGLGLLTFLEYPLFLPWAYFYGGSAVWLAWGATVARYLLLGWLAIFVVRTEGSVESLLGRLRLRRGLRLAPAFGGAVLMLVAAGCAQPSPQPIVSPPTSAAARAASVSSPTGATDMTPLAAASSRPVATDSCGAQPARLQLTPGDPGSNDVDWQVPAGRFFSQAADRSRAGFSIFDDEQANFWSEFQRLGGWGVLGYPASRRFTWHGTLAQTTQRAVLEWSPVTGQVTFANVLDVLHEQGLDEVLSTRKQIPPPTDVDEVGLPYETIAARRLQWLDERPAIRDKYCNAPGGADPLALWGLPTSTIINVGEPAEVYVIRTQRAAFQEWVAGAPWAAPGEVTVVLAGDLAKEFKLVPADSTLPEPAPDGT